MSLTEKNTLDHFYWQGLSILQNEVVHKVGTDAVLLGVWTSQMIKDPSYILDAGTGTGILAIYMATRFPKATVKAVDLDENAIQLAMMNVQATGLKDRISVGYDNLLLLPLEREERFDVILSNPPFYDGHVLPHKDFKTSAKHSLVPVAVWVDGLLSRSTPDADVCIIVPSQRAIEWIAAFNENGYYNQHRLDVYSFEMDLYPKRSLLHFARSLTKPVINKLTIYDSDNTYTAPYLNLTGIRPS